MKNEQLKVSLDPKLIKWIKNKAKADFCSISNVIRQLIVDAKKKNEN